MTKVDDAVRRVKERPPTVFRSALSGHTEVAQQNHIHMTGELAEETVFPGKQPDWKLLTSKSEGLTTIVKATERAGRRR